MFIYLLKLELDEQRRLTRVLGRDDVLFQYSSDSNNKNKVPAHCCIVDETSSS